MKSGAAGGNRTLISDMASRHNIRYTTAAFESGTPDRSRTCSDRVKSPVCSPTPQTHKSGNPTRTRTETNELKTRCAAITLWDNKVANGEGIEPSFPVVLTGVLPARRPEE